MKLTTLLTEMAAPSRWMQEQKFYHGTETEASAKFIIQNGLPTTATKSRAQMAPVFGRAYLTTDPAYAVIYALGGDMFGHDMSDMMKKGRYGYVCVFRGAEVTQDAQPDEDRIGSAIHAAFVEPKDRHYYHREQLSQNVFKDQSLMDELRYMAQRYLTPTQLRKLKDGEYAYFASSGKRMARYLDHRQIDKLIQYGAHVAYAGVLKPIEVLQIDRTKSKLMSKSKPFEHAQLIWKREGLHEDVQTHPLYHSMDLEHFVKALGANELPGYTTQRFWPDGRRRREDEPGYKGSSWMKGISTTRDKAYAKDWKGDVIVVLDRDKLRQSHRVHPYAWNYHLRQDQQSTPFPISRDDLINHKKEREEFVQTGETPRLSTEGGSFPFDDWYGKPQGAIKNLNSVMTGFYVSKDMKDVGDWPREQKLASELSQNPKFLGWYAPTRRKVGS